MVEARWDRKEEKWAIIRNNEAIGYFTGDDFAEELNNLSLIDFLRDFVSEFNIHMSDKDYDLKAAASFIETLKKMVYRKDQDKDKIVDYILKNIDHIDYDYLYDVARHIDDVMTTIDNNPALKEMK